MRTAFRPLIAAAQDARRQILKEFSQVPKEIANAFAGLGRAQGSTFRGATVEAQRANREIVTAARTAAREQLSIERDLERQRVLAVRTANREMLKEHREAAREEARLAREAANNARAAQREAESFARRTSHRATRFLMPEMPMLSMAHRAAHGVVRGFGIDPTVEGAFERNIELESKATQISNQARLGGQDFSAEEVAARVREVSTKWGLKRGATAEALQHFVDTGGDLQTGMAALDKLGERSIITSTSIDSLGQTAADAAMHMGNVPNKVEKLFTTIDSFGVQADRGALSLRQIATRSPLLLAAAMKFGGAEEENQVKMGAAAQLARKAGGAGNVANAATSVVSLVNSFQKSARLKSFQNAGVEIYNQDGTLRDIFEIVKDSIRATKGSEPEMGKLFMDARAKALPNALMHFYRQAGGGDKGFAAIDAEVSRLTKGTKISDDDARRAVDARMQTTAFKVQQFQNALDDTAQKAQAELLPAMEGLAPVVLKVTEVMGSLARAGLQNPGAAIVAAIIASIGRAGLESGLRAAVERAVMGGGSGVVRAAGAAAIGLGIGGALATGIYTEGVSSIDASEGRMKKAGAELNEFRSASANGKTVDPNRRAALFRKILDEREAIKAMERRRANPLGNDFFDMSGQWDFIKSHLGMSNTDTEIKTRKAMLAEKESAYDKLKATKYEAPDEISRYRAKDPHTTAEQMRAAFKHGGIPELEKIATLTSKQDNTAQQLLESSKNGNALLQQILDKIKAPTGDNSPNVDTGAPGYAGP